MPRPALLPKLLARPAMIFLAVAQVLLALAPLAEGRGANSTPHVEQAGTAEHHAHDEASCAACVARTLLTSCEPPGPADFRLTGGHVVRPGGVMGLPAASHRTGLDARAPPLNRA
jgi:hypothetical protein